MFVLDSESCIFFHPGSRGQKSTGSRIRSGGRERIRKWRKKMSGVLTQGDQPYDIDINYFSGAGVSLMSNL